MKEFSVILRNKISNKLRCVTIKAENQGKATIASLKAHHMHECMHVRENLAKKGKK